MELEDSELDCGDCVNFGYSVESYRYHCLHHETAVVHKTDLTPCEWYEEGEQPEYFGHEEIE
jgi:hypothetical protein